MCQERGSCVPEVWVDIEALRNESAQMAGHILRRRNTELDALQLVQKHLQRANATGVSA